MNPEPKLSAAALVLLSQARLRPDGLTAWLLTTKIGISLRDAATAFRELSSLGMMEERESALFLTAKGRSWIYQNQNQFAFSGKKQWREVPREFMNTPRAIWAPYAPKISRLDKANFRFARPKKMK